MIRDVESQLLTLQWQGEIQTVNVIEYGLGWINVYVVAENVDASLYPITAIQNIVSDGNLPLFAITARETALLASNNVTLLSTPTYGVGEAGYNNGSFLIGMWFLCCNFEN